MAIEMRFLGNLIRLIQAGRSAPVDQLREAGTPMGTAGSSSAVIRHACPFTLGYWFESHVVVPERHRQLSQSLVNGSANFVGLARYNHAITHMPV
jgi:hypothetical protein